ncbi:MAG: hypothetical protein A2W31_08485 [Planctomycetes bacterium RBG_16_64_10]|nr:MAG: hypothetical protein A2W31_08485 [Planctomycetes bacterium RBG_16_64_10]
MKHPPAPLVTPIYVKTQPETAWPDDTFFYLLTANGLFLGRNHQFFRSCVPARHWPSELRRQEAFLVPTYPRMSRRTIERIVGFFSAVAARYGSEAGVLLVWDQMAKQVQVVVPEQLATVSRNQWGDVFPIGLKYTVPTDLPPTWVLIGDVHSHVDAAATPSSIDDRDETHRAGLHIIVGRLNAEPPSFHVEAVVDGTRFRLATDQVVEAYERRAPRAPQDWMDKVRVRILGSGSGADHAGAPHHEDGDTR